MHKLIFKRAEYLTSIPSLESFKKLVFLQYAVMLFDFAVIHLFLDFSVLFSISTKQDFNYIQFVVGLDVITMLVALFFNMIKYCINCIEIRG